MPSVFVKWGHHHFFPLIFVWYVSTAESRRSKPPIALLCTLNRFGLATGIRFFSFLENHSTLSKGVRVEAIWQCCYNIILIPLYTMEPSNIIICIAKLPSFKFQHVRFGFYLHFPNVVVSHSAYSRNVHCYQQNINFVEAYQLSKVRFLIPSLHCSTKSETTWTVQFSHGVLPTRFAWE